MSRVARNPRKGHKPSDPPVLSDEIERPRQTPTAPEWSREYPRDAYRLARRYRELREQNEVAAAEVVLRHLHQLAMRPPPRGLADLKRGE